MDRDFHYLVYDAEIDDYEIVGAAILEAASPVQTSTRINGDSIPFFHPKATRNRFFSEFDFQLQLPEYAGRRESKALPLTDSL